MDVLFIFLLNLYILVNCECQKGQKFCMAECMEEFCEVKRSQTLPTCHSTQLWRALSTEFRLMGGWGPKSIKEDTHSFPFPLYRRAPTPDLGIWW